MNWETILMTFGFMVVGYLIGSIVNSIWLTKLLGLKDVRQVGSKSAGATNVRRIHGNYVGICVFILDIIKPIIAMVLPWAIFGPEKVILPAVGIAAIIGHILPIYYRFKGGKGAASMLGFIICLSWPLTGIGFLFFTIIVAKTKKASLGSLIAPLIIALFYFGFHFIPHYLGQWTSPLFYTYNFWLPFISYLIVILIVTIAHKDNIKRLLQGKENLAST